MPTINAIHQLQALLGAESTDDTTWYELLRFQAVAHPIVQIIWQLDQESLLYPWRLIRPANDAEQELLRERCCRAALQVQQVLGNETSACAAAFLLHPQLWEPSYLEHQHYPVRNVSAGLLRMVAETCIQQAPPVDWLQRLCRRLITLCMASAPGGAPDFARCMQLVLEYEDAQTTPFLDALCTGDWDAAARSLVLVATTEQQPLLAHGLQQHWGMCATLTERLLRRFADTQRLDPVSCHPLLATLPAGLQTLNYTLMLIRSNTLVCITL